MIMNALEWQNKGQLVKVNGFSHFVYHSQNSKPYLLVLHGYPTCTYDFYKTLPILEQKFCVVMHDHLGFGYSDKPVEYSYSLMEQTDQALMLWKQLRIDEATILAHDYGTSIATELVARRPEASLPCLNIKQLLLCNGSIRVEMAQLRMIQKLLLNRFTGPLVAKISNRHIFKRNLLKLYFDSNKVKEQEIDALYEMMTVNNGRQVLHKTTQYIKQRYTHWNRWVGGLRETDLPVHLVWAKNDPVAIYEMAIKLHQEIQNSVLTTIECAGHFPMLETPIRWSDAVISTLRID